MKKKRIISAMLALAMVVSLAGCGTSKTENTGEQATEVTTTQEQTTEEETTEEEVQKGNMIVNGDFSDGTSHFDTYTNGGSCDISVSGGELKVFISKLGTVEHGVQLYYDGFALQQGSVYRLAFDVHSTLERDFDWRIQINGGDYHAYSTETIHVTEEPLHYETEFSMDEPSDPAPRLCFNMGYVPSMEEAGLVSEDVEAHEIYFDNLELELVDDSAAVEEAAAVEVPKVKINQVGYAPSAEKIAVFSDLEEEDTTFTVVDVDYKEVVYEGTMGEALNNSYAGEVNCHGDFSEVKTPGTYKIVTGKGEESYPFTIGTDVYTDTFHALVKMLYLQRCGMELAEEFAGEFAHPECHMDQATIYDTTTKIDVSGGWHDAGDYGRYVVSGAKAVADLLLAYEKNPAAFSDEVGTVDSGDGIPDILQEVKYELDWMLKMQADNGGVYHKVTCKVFPETVLPQDETEELIVSPISKIATEDFAAVMAMAARIYGNSGIEGYDTFGSTCLQASQKAWSYAQEHKNDRNFKNPSDISTGEYADGNGGDEYFWAAAELYKTTEDGVYLTAMKESLERFENYGGLGWMDMAGFGVYEALTTPALLTDSSNFAKTIKDEFLAAAEEVVALSEKDAYMVSRKNVYEWGSNMGVANDGMLLLFANEIQPKEEYVTCAKRLLNYLLGVNATGYCFVTGEGSLCPENPHHRPSQVLGTCMPGMLVGGPNSNLEDPYAKAVLKDTPPAKCYADNAQSFSCNEITIYWNSPLIYLMAVQGTEE